MSKTYDLEALEYIAKIADGGMRDAITMLDKCLAYSNELTLQNVVDVLGTVDYDDMMKLTDEVVEHHTKEVLRIVDELYIAGKDLKQFIKSYMQFLLDVQKIAVGCDWQYVSIPKLDNYQEWFQGMSDYEYDVCFDLLDLMIKVNTEVKYSSSVKYDLQAYMVQFIGRDGK